MLNNRHVELTPEAKSRLRKAARQVISSITPRYRPSFCREDGDGEVILVPRVPDTILFDSRGCYVSM